MIFITNFNQFVLNEMNGINKDVSIISEYIYNNFNKIIDGKNIKTNEIKIYKIYINIDNNDIGSLNIAKSSLTKNGLILYLKLKDNTKSVIYHEIHHSLLLFFEDKQKILDKLNRLNAFNLPVFLFNNIELKEFVNLYYLSEKYENDAYINNIYVELLNYFKSLNIKSYDEFNQIFKTNIKNNNLYKISEDLKNYDFNKLIKNIGKDNLIKFFTMFEENYEYLNNIDNYWKKLKYLIRKKFILLFNETYYLNIDKENVNIDKILKQYEIRFKSSSEYLKNKMHKLYNLFIEDLKKDFIK